MNAARFGMDTITLAGPLEAKLRAIREGGFTQVMLSARDIVGHPAGEAAAVAAVHASGLRVTGFQVLRDFEGLSGHLHDYKVDIAKSMLTMCKALGSPVLLACSSTSAHAEGDRVRIAADLAKLAMLAVPFGIDIAFEALSWGRFIHDVGDAWDVVERADRYNLGLAIDSYHLLATSTSVDALDEIDPARIFFVQLSDFMWTETPTPDDRRETARHFRVYPGEGVHSAEIADLVRRLDENGYAGDYSFEVFNDDYVQMPLDAVVARANASVRWVMSRLPRRGLPFHRPGASAP